MFSAIADAIKFIFSKDFRDTVLDVSRLIGKSKDWKKDVKLLSGSIPGNSREDAGLIIKTGCDILQEKKWQEDEIKNISFIYGEIVTNAFKHGLKGIDKGKVKIALTITSIYVRLVVTDDGVGFSLNDELSKQGALAGGNKHFRGLSTICQITPEISQSYHKHKHSISVLCRQGMKPLKVDKIHDIHIFQLEGINEKGYDWNRFIEKINLIAKNEKVILNFGRGYDGSETMMIREFTHEVNKAREIADLHIVVCGLSHLSFPVQEFFKSQFKSFDSQDEALFYLRYLQLPFLPPEDTFP